MSQPPEPPPLQSIQTADALYTRVLTRGRRLRRERRAFLATAAMSFLMLAAAIPVALTNDDGSQVATTDRTRPTRTSTTSTTMAEPVFNFPEETTTTLAPVPVVQGTTVTTARSTTTTRRRATTTTPTTARQATTAVPATTTTVAGSKPATPCNPIAPANPTARGRILFVRDGDIFSADPATQATPPINLTQTPGTAESAPVWSADGTSFAFVRSGSIWILSAAAAPGTPGDQLTPTGAGDSAPAWSWDNSTIAFVRGGNIWTVPTGGTSATLAIDLADPLGNPTWSPDSCRLAYTWRGKVVVSRTDGSGAVGVRDGAAEPSWSRANQLAVSIQVGETRDIFVGNPAPGATFTRATTGGGSNPSWSGTGDRFAFERNGDIYRAQPGQLPEAVAVDPAVDTAPAY